MFTLTKIIIVIIIIIIIIMIIIIIIIIIIMIIITIVMVFNAHKIKVHILVVTDYELYIIKINRELTSHMWFPVGSCITSKNPILKLYSLQLFI